MGDVCRPRPPLFGTVDERPSHTVCRAVEQTDGAGLLRDGGALRRRMPPCGGLRQPALLHRAKGGREGDGVVDAKETGQLAVAARCHRRETP